MRCADGRGDAKAESGLSTESLLAESAKESFAKYLLSQTLEAFAAVEFPEAHRLRSGADVLSESAKESFAEYLHGRHQERANAAEQI